MTQSPPPSERETYTRYARIRSRDAGVRSSSCLTKESQRGQLFPPLVPLPLDPPTITFHLILDPLLFGVLPQSVVPILWWIGGAIVLGLWAVKPVIGMLEGVAVRVGRKDE